MPKVSLLNIPFYLAAALLAVLPFHPFLMTWLGSVMDVSLLKAWKELLIVFLCGWIFVTRGHTKTFWKFDVLDWLIVSFAALSLLTGALFTGNGWPENMMQIVWGFKYGVLFLVLFFFVRRWEWSQEQTDVLMNITLISMSVVVGFGIMQVLVLPADFLTLFGYSSVYGNTEVAQNGLLSYCHKIELPLSSNEFCRVQSFLSGPNQLAAYLIVTLSLFFVVLQRTVRPVRQNTLRWLLLGVGVLVLLLTWGRAAMLGSLFAFAVYFLASTPVRRVAWALIGVTLMGITIMVLPLLLGPAVWDATQLSSSFVLGVLALLSLVLAWRSYSGQVVDYFAFVWGSVLGSLAILRLWFGEFVWNILVRPSSTQGHGERMADGMRWIWENPWGLGLGDAGPASARFARAGETGFLPESWYLQVGLESGMLGLLLFLGIILFVGCQLWQRRDQTLAFGMLLGLIAVSVACLFLHSWEAAPVAFTFWLLAGIALSRVKT